MIDEADRDGDGQISEDEFIKIMKKTNLFGWANICTEWILVYFEISISQYSLITKLSKNQPIFIYEKLNSFKILYSY